VGGGGAVEVGVAVGVAVVSHLAKESIPPPWEGGLLRCLTIG
jgi:hypothetical protein